jgi:hypothetical protein
MSDSKLADLNSATLGAKMPEITLPDGSVVQTGTVGWVFYVLFFFDPLDNLEIPLWFFQPP